MLSDILYRLRALFRRKGVEAELEEEMRYHLEREIEKHLRAGLSEEEARRQARIAFGGVEQIRQDCRQARGLTLLENLWQDLRYSLRTLWRSYGFSLAVLLTLTLAIGVNSTIFTLLDGFLLRTLPYPEPNRIGVLTMHEEGKNPRTGALVTEENETLFGETWEQLKTSTHGVLLAAQGGAGGVNIQTGTSSGNLVKYVQEARVSAHYFDVLGVAPRLGRGFTEEEDRAGGGAAVVLSGRLWRTAFHSDPKILGAKITLKGEPTTVVGILPAGAALPLDADVYTPLRPAPQGECGGDNCVFFLRLLSGTTWQQVNAQIAHLPRPSYLPSRIRVWFYVRPMQRFLSGDMRLRLEILMFAVGCILLIACANLAGLTIVRMARQAPELATRLALGATRRRVLFQLWMGNLVLAVLGGLSGFGAAFGFLHLAEKLLPEEMIPLGGLSLNPHVLLFTAGIAILTSLLFGALPLLTTRHLDLRSELSSGVRSTSGGSRRLRQFLVGGEIALTVVLLSASGLLVRTLMHLENMPPGFDGSNVMTAKASLSEKRFSDPVVFNRLMEKSVEAMRQIPGVEEAAVGLALPYQRGLNLGMVLKDGPHAGQENSASASYITPGYFASLRIPLLQGRGFLSSDNALAQRVIVVNADFARRFYNGENPIGRHVLLLDNEEVYTIAGVVGSVKKKPGDGSAPLAIEPVIYFAAAQVSHGLLVASHLWFQPSWVVRTRGPVEGLNEAMQKALSSADPALPFAGFRSMQDLLEERLQMQHMEVTLLGALAGLAVLLSALGIYALVSSLVVQRTREIGIRIALGSTLKRAMFQVSSAGGVAAVGGVCLGLALSFFILRLLQSEIYGVTRYDGVTLITVPVLLLGIAAVASALPALRIAKINPAKTLRAE